MSSNEFRASRARQAQALQREPFSGSPRPTKRELNRFCFYDDRDVLQHGSLGPCGLGSTTTGSRRRAGLSCSATRNPVPSLPSRSYFDPIIGHSTNIAYHGLVYVKTSTGCGDPLPSGQPRQPRSMCRRRAWRWNEVRGKELDSFWFLGCAPFRDALSRPDVGPRESTDHLVREPVSSGFLRSTAEGMLLHLLRVMTVGHRLFSLDGASLLLFPEDLNAILIVWLYTAQGAVSRSS